jgi:hypothetical protein
VLQGGVGYLLDSHIEPPLHIALVSAKALDYQILFADCGVQAVDRTGQVLDRAGDARQSVMQLAYLLVRVGRPALLAVPGSVAHVLGHDGSERSCGPLERGPKRIGRGIAVLRRTPKRPAGITSIALECGLIPVYQIVIETIVGKVRIRWSLRAGIIPVRTGTGFIPISWEGHD